MWIVFDEPNAYRRVARSIPVSRVLSIDLVDDRKRPEGAPESLCLRVRHEPITPDGDGATGVIGAAADMRHLYLSLLSLTSRLDMSTAVIISRFDDESPWRCERLSPPAPPARAPAPTPTLRLADAVVNHYGHKTPDSIAASVRRRAPSTACPIEQEPLLAPLVAARWYPMRDPSGEPMGVLTSDKVGASLGGGLGEWFAQAEVTTGSHLPPCAHGAGAAPYDAMLDLATKMMGYDAHSDSQVYLLVAAAHLLLPSRDPRRAERSPSIDTHPAVAPLVAAGWRARFDLAGLFGVKLESPDGYTGKTVLAAIDAVTWCAATEVTVRSSSFIPCESGRGGTPAEALFALAENMMETVSHPCEQPLEVQRWAAIAKGK